MKGLELNLLRSTPWIAVAMALLLWAPTASLAESSSPAAQHIETYYQQLMPTLEAAGQLSVGERDRRFAPAIRSAFDIATMTRLATVLPGAASRAPSRPRFERPSLVSSSPNMLMR